MSITAFVPVRPWYNQSLFFSIQLLTVYTEIQFLYEDGTDQLTFWVDPF